MTLFWWLTGAVGAAALVAVTVAMLRTHRPFRSLGKSAAGGFLTLAAVNVAGGLTGVSLGLGWLSGGVCIVLGLPGVVMLLFLKTIFFA